MTALTIMTNNNIALDTNVLIYIHDSSSSIKKTIAEDLLADNPFISSQVISEYLNTTRRLLQLSKDELLAQTSNLLADCTIIPVLSSTLLSAAELVKKYHFQLFDAVIVSAAKENNCAILYSEDMQHGLVVDKSLTIINPFL
ncbi:MAG: PIN domain-containing protein [Bacteroidota bacterium]|nr:PIN domain-containing protein [Bacteroidota bacterium]